MLAAKPPEILKRTLFFCKIPTIQKGETRLSPHPHPYRKKKNPNRAKQIQHGRRVQGEDGTEQQKRKNTALSSVLERMLAVAEFIVASPFTFTPIFETGSDLVK